MWRVAAYVLGSWLTWWHFLEAEQRTSPPGLLLTSPLAVLGRAPNLSEMSSIGIMAHSACSFSSASHSRSVYVVFALCLGYSSLLARSAIKMFCQIGRSCICIFDVGISCLRTIQQKAA